MSSPLGDLTGLVYPALLIILAKESTLDLDQKKKNEIIATAYLLIGETQKAMDILERD